MHGVGRHRPCVFCFKSFISDATCGTTILPFNVSAVPLKRNPMPFIHQRKRKHTMKVSRNAAFIVAFLSDRIYTETDPDLPKYPLNFQVARYCVFEKVIPS